MRPPLGRAGQISGALGQDRCGSLLPINRYFFSFFRGSEARLKTDMSDTIIFFPEYLFVMGTVCHHRQKHRTHRGR